MHLELDDGGRSDDEWNENGRRSPLRIELMDGSGGEESDDEYFDGTRDWTERKEHTHTHAHQAEPHPLFSDGC